MAKSAKAPRIMNSRSTRTIFRWIHIAFAIPIIGYIYSPFDKIPQYAAPTRFVFVPVMVLSGLWMWKGHVVRGLISKRWGRITVRARTSEPRSADDAARKLERHLRG